MAFDGLFLHMMQQELADFAVGSKIDKIYLPTKYELVMSLRSRSGVKKLFISVGGNAPRICFTDNVPENPAKPPMLCMLFRKLLTGAVITGFRQQGMDRILFIDLDASNEIGDRVKRVLVVEIMAQYSNCILLDDKGTVIDSLKRVDGTKSSFREILPGLPYILPPAQDKLNIMTADKKEIAERLLLHQNKMLSSALLNTFSGFSPLTAKEIAYRVCLGDKTVDSLSQANYERLYYEIEELKTILASGKSKPCYLTAPDGEMLSFSFMPLTYMANDAKINECVSLSALLDVFYTEKEKKQRARVQAEDLFKTVNALLERTLKKINIRRAELPDDEEIEEKRICAELINVNIAFLPKGVQEYELQNYYDNNAIKKIKAYPELSPQKNAQRYYKEYRKAQTAKKVLAEQIENGMNEFAYLQTVQDELNRAETFSELAEIRRELLETGFIKSAPQQNQKKPAATVPLEFTSPDGFRVLVGRNNLQNDRLSFKIANKNDLWFHVQKAPGSHVILCTEGREPSEAACEFAAGLAVFYSSVRERGKAEVDYTLVKNLKKPPASNPGFVVYHVYKTIYAQCAYPNR